MNAGKLDRIAVLRGATQTRSSTGAVVVTWADVARFAVSKRTLNAREVMISARPTDQIEDVFECRYRTDVTAAQQLVVDGNTYDIVRPPEEIGRKDGLRIFGKVRIK